MGKGAFSKRKPHLLHAQVERQAQPQDRCWKPCSITIPPLREYMKSGGLIGLLKVVCDDNGSLVLAPACFEYQDMRGWVQGQSHFIY
jgi:hypothetical protein